MTSLVGPLVPKFCKPYSHINVFEGYEELIGNMLLFMI